MDRAPQPLASRTGSGDSSGPIISSSSLNAKNGTERAKHHETLGKQTQKVTVKAKEDAKVAVEMAKK